MSVSICIDATQSLGLAISLPFELGVNKYVSAELAFEFHYFFTRKYWMLYFCRAMVCLPGGAGTLDEFWEVVCLIQTRKIKERFPIVLLGKDYWCDVVNLKKMADWGTHTQNGCARECG